MNGNYISYLKSSSCYKNINDALKIIKNIKENMDKFYEVFDKDVSGNVIDEFKDKYKIIDGKVEEYIPKIEEIIKKLEENAKKGDKVLSAWRNKINTDFVPSKCISTSEKDDEKTTDTLYKKISAVGIDSDGYIKITIHVYVYRVIKTISTGKISSTDTINKGDEYYKVDFSGNAV